MMEFAERNYGRIFLLTTSLLLLAAIFGKQPGSSVTLAVMVIGVAVLGLPHGALDPAVASRVLGHRRFFRRPRFFAVYALIALAYGLLWWKWPTLGLVSFLLIAACHFGSDWDERGTALTRTGYGLAIVTLPALSHPAAVVPIYQALGTNHAATITQCSAIAAVTFTLIASLPTIMRWRERRNDLIEFLAIVCGAVFLQPLIFFTCYFTLLHSPRHLLQTANSLDLRGLRAICRTTAPIVLTTILLGVVAFFLIPVSSVSVRLLGIVFVGLASLTVPHMILEMIATGSTKTSGGQSLTSSGPRECGAGLSL